MFQHTATRRWLLNSPFGSSFKKLFQHTATRRWLPMSIYTPIIRYGCFNTQPPEGGCLRITSFSTAHDCFNTQPPEGGCFHKISKTLRGNQFQHTATRRWLLSTHKPSAIELHCFNTQPPEGGCALRINAFWVLLVSTHSHPKVAASSNSSSFRSL